VWTYFLVLAIILGSLIVLLGLVALLGRIQNGRFLRPIYTALAKIPFMRRAFEKMSRATLERQNPELMAAVDKLQRIAGKNPDPERAQKALMQLSPAERRAYLQYTEQQGLSPEAPNRQARRQQQRLQQGRGPSGVVKGAGKRRR
jgi:hypothetical protein